jgi:hypothetical protein
MMALMKSDIQKIHAKTGSKIRPVRNSKEPRKPVLA